MKERVRGRDEYRFFFFNLKLNLFPFIFVYTEHNIYKSKRQRAQNDEQ